MMDGANCTKKFPLAEAPKGERMARYSDLQREADRRSVRLEAQLHDAELDPCRDRLELKPGQIRVAPNLSSWAYSPGLRTPE